MSIKTISASKDFILLKDRITDFSEQVKKLSNIDFNQCYHCQSCSGGCPFSHIMDYLPNRVIRLIQFGQKEKALKCSSIWICVGCDTCAIQCPNAVDISSVMKALCRIAIEEGYLSEPDIYDFHKEVLNSINRYGRTHKLEIMMRYKLRKRDWFGDMGVGTKMLLKRKLEFFPSRVDNMEEIKQLFEENRI